MPFHEHPAPAPLREVMSMFATGVIVVAVGGEHPHGMTANAFSSVSLEPAQVLCCVAHSAVMHKSINSERHFAISIMAADQERHARHFADKSRPLGAPQFEAFDWHPGPSTGAPLLGGALAWIECILAASHDSGDHSIFVGSVINSLRGSGADGLVFFDGTFRPGVAPV